MKSLLASIKMEECPSDCVQLHDHNYLLYYLRNVGLVLGFQDQAFLGLARWAEMNACFRIIRVDEVRYQSGIISLYSVCYQCPRWIFDVSLCSCDGLLHWDSRIIWIFDVHNIIAFLRELCTSRCLYQINHLFTTTDSGSIHRAPVRTIQLDL